MNKSGTVLVVVFLLALATFPGSAATAAATKWRGYVIDRQCAESVRDDSNPRTFIQRQTKDCLLMPNCRAAGYSLYCDGKWLDLDKKGNQLAIKLLQASQKKSGFYVETAGTVRGKVLKVQSMKEIEEPVMTEEPSKN